jgi:hypothetical protein
MKQNISHAVMSQRNPNMDSFDNFPTPPWAVRGFIESQLSGSHDLSKSSCLEPACGQGYMSEALKEYFAKVVSFDVIDYGYGDMTQTDFLNNSLDDNSFDWVITNPPFKAAEDFIFEAQRVARIGVAMLVRTVFIESVGRYERLFCKKQPSFFAQYVERVAMVKGRLDRKASTATGYGWIVWEKNNPTETCTLKWIQPSRKRLEKNSDYGESFQKELFG